MYNPIETLYYDKDVHLTGEFTELGLFLHCYMNGPFTRDKYNRYLVIFGDILLGLRKRGIEVYTAVSETNKKLQKFVSLFGFVKTGLDSIDTNGDFKHIYVCRLLDK